MSQAAFVARGIAVPDLITYDIGGTSTDVCLIKGFAASVTTEALLAGFPLKTPQLDIKSVGAGGGSIAWVDVDGSLQVGPQSAGADPGPACYGRGGREATVSDANLALGRLGATRSLGGALTPDPTLAAQAIARLAERLGGFDAHRLAEGIIRIMVARTVSSISEITIQRGHDPRDFALMAFGGAGGMHAIPTAEELGIARIIVPRWPGNFSALGVATADIKHDAVRTHIAPLDDDYDALRRQIWLATDAAYKRAVGVFARKRAAFQNRTGVEQIPDLSRETPVETVRGATGTGASRGTWVERAQQLSAVFASSPAIETSDVWATETRGMRYYVNSEGFTTIVPVQLANLRVTAEAQADDSMMVRDGFSLVERRLEDLPPMPALVAGNIRALTRLSPAPLSRR